MKKLSLLCSLLLTSVFHLQAQNVGLGTTTPALPLHISRATDTALLLLENTNGLNVNTNVGMYFKNGNLFTGGLRTTGTGTSFARLSCDTVASGAVNALRERLSITDAGFTGIGSTNPLMQLHIVANASFSNVLLMENPLGLAANSTVGSYFKNGTYYTGAIKTIGSGTTAARLSFYTYASTAATGLQERLSIRDDGNVGINTTSPGSQLEVVGASKFLQGSDAVAVEISGPIKVSGSNKPAFVLVCSASNLTDLYQPTINYTANANYYTSVFIDNALCNGDPNAIVMVTAQNIPVPFAVVYDNSYAKWKITINHNSVKEDGCWGSGSPSTGCGPYVKVFFDYQPLSLSVGQKFNVMVVKQ